MILGPMAKIKISEGAALRFKKKKPTKGRKTRPDGYKRKKSRK